VLFNSYQFIFAFLPIVLAGCFLLARLAGPGGAQLWLIGASLYFYASWNAFYLPLLLGSIGFNYVIAILMVRQESETRRKWLLLAAVAVDLGLLAYYKYTNFFLGAVNDLTGTRYAIAAIILPLGISFYTFQQLTLLIDVSAGRIKDFRLRDFVLFVIFFPHLIAGPIVHHREMMPQFETAKFRFDWSNMAVGLTLFAAGLFKKAILADGIAAHVTPLYHDAASGHAVSILFAWAATVGFTLQMYFDFSGYSEMALGLARMVGIKLPMNFYSPLKSVGLIEFWSRWHMTLTRFLTAYLFNAQATALHRWWAGKGRKGVKGAKTKFPAFFTLVGLPTFTTMFLSGLWHGAGYQYLVWGSLHGIYLAVNQGWRLYRTKFFQDTPRYHAIARPLGLVVTLVCVFVAMAYFRAPTVAAGTNLVAGMAGLHGIALPAALLGPLGGIGELLARLGVAYIATSAANFVAVGLWCAILLLIALTMPNILEILRDYEPALPSTAPVAAIAEARSGPWHRWTQTLLWRPTLGWAMATAGATVFGVLALNQITEFLYWQF
jgi:D-alanyl-lipoteichoic acid acyltransferase DltB (MBOAT superfamily)